MASSSAALKFDCRHASLALATLSRNLPSDHSNAKGASWKQRQACALHLLTQRALPNKGLMFVA